MATLASSTLRSVFVTGLQNAHAVENQALALIDRQLDRIVRYPEIADRLRSHRVETEVQIRRLDEILKDQMVNYAFENFEIASYSSLIALADAGGFTSATSLLGETLSEEERMAAWVLESLPGLTLKYVGLSSLGEKADR